MEVPSAEVVEEYRETFPYLPFEGESGEHLQTVDEVDLFEQEDSVQPKVFLLLTHDVHPLNPS